MEYKASSWLYRSGDVFLSPAARAFLRTYIVGDDESLFYISYWSVVHMISGIVFALLWSPKASPYMAGFAVHTCWEAWQIFIGMTPVGTARGFIDIITDTVMFMFGMWLVVNFYVHAQK
jgi:hypothetical protein